MPKVHIPTPLRQYVNQQAAVDAAGATVGEVLASLTNLYPELKKNIYNDEGKLRSFVNIYVNDEDIRYMSKDATAVTESDSVTIVPSIAGGTA
jgi:adenylyltransferase/sulfurtransferase